MTARRLAAGGRLIITMKLYHITPRPGHPGSHNAAKVRILLNEIGAAYELIDCDPVTQLRPPDAAFRRLNPNGLTPVIDDDGFTLWESSAVLQYLADRYQARSLYPTAAQPRALIQQWLAWETSTLTPALMAAFTELSETAAIAQATRLRLDAATGVLEQQLALAGHGAFGDYSIADIALGCTAAALFLIGWPLQGRAALLNWIGRLAARPGWQEEVIQNDIETARQAGYNI